MNVIFGVLLLILCLFGVAGVIVLILLTARVLTSNPDSSPLSSASCNIPSMPSAHPPPRDEERHCHHYDDQGGHEGSWFTMHRVRTFQGTYGRFRLATRDLDRLIYLMDRADSREFRIHEVTSADRGIETDPDISKNEKETRSKWIERINMTRPSFRIEQIWTGLNDGHKWMQLNDRSFYFPRDMYVSFVIPRK